MYGTEGAPVIGVEYIKGGTYPGSCVTSVIRESQLTSMVQKTKDINGTTRDEGSVHVTRSCEDGKGVNRGGTCDSCYQTVVDETRFRSLIRPPYAFSYRKRNYGRHGCRGKFGTSVGNDFVRRTFVRYNMWRTGSTRPGSTDLTPSGVSVPVG